MYKLQKLKTGLRYITVPMEETKAVTVLVLVGTGSKYETKDKSGISHFLEHLFFKGTKKRPSPLHIARELDEVGGEYNAFTGKEHTGFYVKLASKHLDLALDILSDILLHSQFDEAEIEKEKGVILQEINLYKDTPIQYIEDVFESLLYGNQPAGWKIIGRKETVKEMERKIILSYFNTHYLAPNTVIGIAGDIKEKAAKKIDFYFKKLPQGTRPAKEKTKQVQKKPQVLISSKKTDQTHLSLGVRAFDMFHKDRFALQILATILGGNMSSRLFTRIRAKMGAAYYVKTEYQAYQDTGYLTTRVGVGHKDVSAVVKVICEEYNKLLKKSPPKKELAKAKEYIKGKTLLNLESSDSQASFYSKQELLRDKIESIEEKFKQIDAVTPAKLHKVSKDIFQNSKLNLALVGPHKSKDKLTKILTI